MENKKISTQMSEAELQKAIDQIPQEYVQEAMAHIPEEDIEKISQMKEINIENLEKLSAGLSHKTKDFLKFLGASAAITSIGIGGGYLIGRKVGKKEGRKEGRKEGFDLGYTSAENDEYFKGFSRGEEITLEGVHQKMIRLIQKNPDSDHAVAAIIAWFSKHGANG